MVNQKGTIPLEPLGELISAAINICSEELSKEERP